MLKNAKSSPEKSGSSVIIYMKDMDPDKTKGTV